MRKKRKENTRSSIYDVAKHAGVSITTVSRVINNIPTVKEYNREKVSRAIDELGFSPDMNARRLAGGRINTIGLVIPRFEDMFYTFYVTEVLRGVCNTANEAGLDVLIHVTSRDMTDKKLGLHMENLSFCSGVIFADIQGNEKLIDSIVKEEIPCIVINHFDKGLDAGCIAIDNREGAVKAVDYLVSLGHERIATITGELSIQAGRDRLEGYKDSLKKNGMKLDETLIKECDFSPKRARLRALELLDSGDYPTAIFVASDEMAAEVMRTLIGKKLRVPQDISIVGFDDSWFALQGALPLTTVKQPLALMAERAVKNLRDAISSRTKTAFKKDILATELVIRESCVPPLKREDLYS